MVDMISIDRLEYSIGKTPYGFQVTERVRVNYTEGGHTINRRIYFIEENGFDDQGRILSKESVEGHSFLDRLPLRFVPGLTEIYQMANAAIKDLIDQNWASNAESALA